MKHQELIAALERATGPDRELDAAIQCSVINGSNFGRYASQADWVKACIEQNWNTPAYTASIDAAMGLVPEHSDYDFGSAKLVGSFWALVIDPDNEHAAKGCKSQAIAICIAALKARALNSKDET